MTNNNNLKSITENKKPVELVQEIDNKYQVPSFEEFMETYESDENLNYDDLSGGSVGEVKGYGPTGDYTWREVRNGTEYTGCGQVAQTASLYFCLRVECHNWNGLGGIRTVNSSGEALYCARFLEDNNWPDSYCISDEVLRKCATLIREAVRHYNRGNRVEGYVKVKGKFWGGYDSNKSY